MKVMILFIYYNYKFVLLLFFKQNL